MPLPYDRRRPTKFQPTMTAPKRDTLRSCARRVRSARKMTEIRDRRQASMWTIGPVEGAKVKPGRRSARSHHKGYTARTVVPWFHCRSSLEETAPDANVRRIICESIVIRWLQQPHRNVSLVNDDKDTTNALFLCHLETELLPSYFSLGDGVVSRIRGHGHNSGSITKAGKGPGTSCPE